MEISFKELIEEVYDPHMTPGSYPDSWTEDPIFIRSFGDMNDEQDDGSDD